MFGKIPSKQPMESVQGLLAAEGVSDGVVLKKLKASGPGTDEPDTHEERHHQQIDLAAKKGDIKLLSPIESKSVAPSSDSVNERQKRAQRSVSQDLLRAYLAPRPDFSKARAKAFDGKKPFMFVALASDLQSQEKKLELVACSPYYDRIDRGNIKGTPRAVDVFYCSRFDGKIHPLGVLGDLDSDSCPLAHHLLMLNDDMFLSEPIDKEEYHESVVAGGIFFELGLYVTKNEKQAAELFASLDQEEQFVAISGIFLEAIGERQLDVAMRCIDHGVGLNSRDKDGHMALFSVLSPGFETILDHLLTSAANKWHIKALKGIIEPVSNWDKAVLANMSEESVGILKQHIERLGLEVKT